MTPMNQFPRIPSVCIGIMRSEDTRNWISTNSACIPESGISYTGIESVSRTDQEVGEVAPSAVLSSKPLQGVRSAADAEGACMFIRRLDKRLHLWYGPLGPRWTPRGFLGRFHRMGLKKMVYRRKELIMRDRNDPDRVWRFCRYWQRTLINKWNSREFAVKHACQVPEIYWCGCDLGQLPIDSIPDHYVIQPIFGDTCNGVYLVADGHDYMTGEHFDKCQMKDRLISEFGELAEFPVMVEEFVRSEKGEYRIPKEYRFHMFGDRVAILTVRERSSRTKTTAHHFDPDWQPFPEAIIDSVPPGGSFVPPGCFDEMVACAKRLGTAFDTYVRIDFYASPNGPVFGEFSSVPGSGVGFTSYADQYLGRVWDEVFPSRV